MQAELPPLALYVHIPWCVRKCPYCDFNSHTLHGELPQAAYLESLSADLAAQRASAAGREIATIFFGGGTPSLIEPEALGRWLAGVRALLPVAPDAEITLEANPGTIEHGRFADYRAAGITRVSLGAQSFAPAQLQRLGRIHGSADIGRCAEELHAVGFTNFNLDLMYGLPEQSAAEALADVEAALALEPAHLSHYQLTIEPGTVFAGRPPAGLPESDLAAQMQQQCRERLADAGFAQYEVAAFARAGLECRHNLNYWCFGDYLGIGAGAHGKCSARTAAGLTVERTWHEREPRRYLAGARSPSRQQVAAEALPFEFMMNALRLVKGFSVPLFEARTGLSWDSVAARVRGLQARGLMDKSDAGEAWSTTALGFSFLNEVLGEFL